MEQSRTTPTVHTQFGVLQGQLLHSVYAFLGVQYGADTSGPNRFLPPKPPASWSGRKRADKMGFRCPQPDIPAATTTTPLFSFSDLPVSENCLVLNVWAPRLDRSANLPVMVFLHGGAFSFGSASDKYYDGASLAGHQNVIVVTLNHRLNGFGHLLLGPEAAPRFAAAANAGMLDIVQALEWVRDNIGEFGGDPSNVTIFGQSGGGGKVATLLTMPRAQGLFQKAIIESGPVLSVSTLEEALAIRNRVLAALDMKPDEVETLQDLPMQKLVAAFAKTGLQSFQPIVDGDILPTQPFEPVATPVSADVPLMIGSNRDEATALLVDDPTWQSMTDDDLQKRVTALLGPSRAPAAIQLYRSRAPEDDPAHLWSSIFTDAFFTYRTIALAERKADQHRAPVFAYKVEWPSPAREGLLRTPHGVELPFVFDNVSGSPELVGSGPSQDKMAELMSSTFASFGRTGNPDNKNNPHWPAYDSNYRETFIFDIPPTVVADPDSDLRLFWDSVGAATFAHR